MPWGLFGWRTGLDGSSRASVTAWLGNSPKVAATNYLMVTDSDFDRAASEATQIPTQCVAECVGIEGSPLPGNEKTPGKPRVLSNSVAGAGFEDPSKHAGNGGIWPKDDAHSDAHPSGADRNPAESTALLTRLADCWRRLTEAEQAEVVALAERLAGHLDDVDGPLLRSSGRMAGASSGDRSAR